MTPDSQSVSAVSEASEVWTSTLAEVSASFSPPQSVHVNSEVPKLVKTQTSDYQY